MQQFDISLLRCLLLLQELRLALSAWLRTRGCWWSLVTRRCCAFKLPSILLQRSELPRPALAALHTRGLATIASSCLTTVTLMRLIKLSRHARHGLARTTRSIAPLLGHATRGPTHLWCRTYRTPGQWWQRVVHGAEPPALGGTALCFWPPVSIGTRTQVAAPRWVGPTSTNRGRSATTTDLTAFTVASPAAIQNGREREVAAAVVNLFATAPARLAAGRRFRRFF